MRLADKVINNITGLSGHPQVFEIQPSGLPVQQTQHHAFAMAGGQGGNAHIDCPPGHTQGNPSILRQPLFGDVEFGHYLDTRHQDRRQHTLWLQHLAQNAVDAETYYQSVFKGFDMNVRGVFLDRLGQQGIDEANNGGIVFAFQQVFGFRQCLGNLEQVHVITKAFHHLHGFIGALFIGSRKQGIKLFFVDLPEPEWTPHKPTQLDQCLGIGGGRQHNIGTIFAQLRHQHPVPLGKHKRRASVGYFCRFSFRRLCNAERFAIAHRRQHRSPARQL